MVSDEAEEACLQMTTLSQSPDPAASACAWDLSGPLLALKGFVLGPLDIGPAVVASHRGILTQSQGPVESNAGV